MRMCMKWNFLVMQSFVGNVFSDFGFSYSCEITEIRKV